MVTVVQNALASQKPAAKATWPGTRSAPATAVAATARGHGAAPIAGRAGGGGA